MVYLVIRSQNNLIDDDDFDHPIYGIDDSFYLVGIFEDKEKAVEISKKFNSKIVECPALNEEFKPPLTAREFLDIPYEDRYEKLKKLYDENHYQPLLIHISYYE